MVNISNVAIQSQTTVHKFDFDELESCLKMALETYSNVHRGSGHFALITTALYEKAREIIIDYLGINKQHYSVIFCSPYGARLLETQLRTKDYYCVSSKEIGLPIGIRVLIIKKRDLPKGIPLQTGGGVAKMVSSQYVLWEHTPHIFEAGTPGIINVIALAKIIQGQKRGESLHINKVQPSSYSVEEILYKDDLHMYTGMDLLEKLSSSMFGQNFSVPASEGDTPFVNFDNAASTPAFRPVWESVRKIINQNVTIYPAIISEVKKIISVFLNFDRDNYETVFTYNTTESINIAASFLKNEFCEESDVVILNTILEHNSNELPWRNIPGFSQIRLSIDEDGFISNDELEHLLKDYNQEHLYGNKRIRLVAISGASNVLGTFNDIQKISSIVHKYNARILVDGAQLVAHRRISLNQTGIDYFAFSGHKMYAPFGSGALIIRKDFLNIPRPDLDLIKQSGEENIVGIVALGKSASLLQRIGMDNVEKTEFAVLNRLLDGICKIDGLQIYGIKDTSSKNIPHKGALVTFGLKNVFSNVIARELAEQGGIGVRYGCFCAHILVKHLLKFKPAFIIFQNVILTILTRFFDLSPPGLLRVSLGIENTISEIDLFLSTLQKIVRSHDSKSPDKRHQQSSKIIRSQIDSFVKERVQKTYYLSI